LNWIGNVREPQAYVPGSQEIAQERKMRRHVNGNAEIMSVLCQFIDRERIEHGAAHRVSNVGVDLRGERGRVFGPRI